MPIWNIPYPRNPYFTGRDELLDQLTQQLSPEVQKEGATIRRAALTQPQAIKGLGGIGKTQIAVEYAYRSRDLDRYIHTFWVNAASEETLLTSFAALAELLPAFPAKDEMDQHKLVEALKHWLEQCQQCWLLIFDNADDIALVQNYLPPRDLNGSILLTTRANAVGAVAASIEVTTMGFVEGTQLLLRRAQCFENASDEEFNQAGNIVIALDHFPLSLDQAGAYIEETGCSFVGYLQAYYTHRKELLTRRGAQATSYPASVATTWSLSFQKVQQANPAAAELLQLCAFLAPERIPEEMIKEGTIYWPSLLQQATTDSFTFDEMLKELLKFSLMKRFAEDHMLSIHRLVQAVQIDMMETDIQCQWAERVVQAVSEAFPYDHKDIATWPQYLRYLEQAQACYLLIEHYGLQLVEAADLLCRTGVYLYVHGLYAEAEPLYRRALSIREQQLGPDHPDIALSLNNLAALYRAQGKYAEAEPLYQRALSIREQQLGPESLEVTYPLNNLAAFYQEQGLYTEAEPLYQRALSIREQQLEPDHLDAAFSLNNLAALYKDQGRYVKAESLYQRVLSIREQQLGPEHPEIANSLSGLATLYKDQGKYSKAELLYQRALSIREQQLGPEHPDTAQSLNNLATLYYQQRKYAKAEPLYQRALFLLEHAPHFNTAQSLNNLACLYYQQGKYAKAEPLYQRALSIREQQLGPRHPSTQIIYKNYHTLLHTMERHTKQGRWKRILGLFGW